MPHGWAGLGWAGLGWAGLGWAGLGWAGLTTHNTTQQRPEGGKGQECDHEQFCSVSCLADSLLPPCWLLLYAVYYQSA
ncbi:hypothetical protein V8C86DRAFT_2781576, partial [Haematococcus lacustris]